jgi:hypothetical protein
MYTNRYADNPPNFDELAAFDARLQPLQVYLLLRGLCRKLSSASPTPRKDSLLLTSKTRWQFGVLHEAAAERM